MSLTSLQSPQRRNVYDLIKSKFFILLPKLFLLHSIFSKYMVKGLNVRWECEEYVTDNHIGFR